MTRIESYPYYPGFEASDLLDLRMACSEMATQWDLRAEHDQDPDACRRIARRYNRLWERLYDVGSKTSWAERQKQDA